MPIWRTTITNVAAERGKINSPSMQVEVNPTIGKVTVEKAGDSELIKVPYTLKIKYGDAGNITVAGDTYFVGESSEIVKAGVLTDSELVRQVYQRIFVEPMVLAISIAKELTLPLPVQMPKVKVGEPKVDSKK